MTSSFQTGSVGEEVTLGWQETCSGAYGTLVTAQDNPLLVETFVTQQQTPAPEDSFGKSEAAVITGGQSHNDSVSPVESLTITNS